MIVCLLILVAGVVAIGAFALMLPIAAERERRAREAARQANGSE